MAVSKFSLYHYHFLQTARFPLLRGEEKAKFCCSSKGHVLILRTLMFFYCMA